MAVTRYALDYGDGGYVPGGESAKETAIENYRDCNVDDSFWYECTVDDWKEKLESMGYESPKISFSGFWSQGDGASFTCDRINLETWLKTQKRKTHYRKLLIAAEIGDFSASVIRIDHHYSHEYTVRCEQESADSVYTLALEFEKEVTEDVRELSRKIYKDLESQYDAMVSDSEVIETIESNEWTFDEDGNPEN